MKNNSSLLNSLESEIRKIFLKLNSIEKIQLFLDSVKYSSDSIYRCPLRVFNEKVGHCFDGAVFAASALSQIGFQPIILDMLPNKRDDDHILALFKIDNHWGAIAKSNFVGLRFREPIYKTLRELVLSYFEQYYNTAKEKTLRGYTVPLNLKIFDKYNWRTDDNTMELIAQKLDKIRKFKLMTAKMEKRLLQVDDRTYSAGLIGVNEAGLFKP
ncbi:MAG: hypothetical protein IPM32_02700 [Ignavibacteriae bacterium]|nr:hypothetical protein [Ignavibacteriota bacterium]